MFNCNTMRLNIKVTHNAVKLDAVGLIRRCLYTTQDIKMRQFNKGSDNCQKLKINQSDQKFSNRLFHLIV